MDTDLRLRRELRFLRAWVVASTTVLGALSVTAFRHSFPTRFDEIDVERINIREANGKLRMVLSNRTRSPDAIAHGKRLSGDGQRPGIIFYNDEETENGGLAFDGRTDSTGRTAGALLAFDQYDQDQIVTLSYDEANGKRAMGLTVIDRPELPTGWFVSVDSAQRLPDGPEKTAAMRRLMGPRNGMPMYAPRAFIGRDSARTAIIRLGDQYGRTRLRLLVDSLGAARIEFLDGRGRVTQQIPALADTTKK